jgi:hypothetical protein
MIAEVEPSWEDVIAAADSIAALLNMKTYHVLILSETTREQPPELWQHMGEKQSSPTRILGHNILSILIAKWQGDLHRTKHIDLRYHYIRSALNDGPSPQFMSSNSTNCRSIDLLSQTT